MVNGNVRSHGLLLYIVFLFPFGSRGGSKSEEPLRPAHSCDVIGGESPDGCSSALWIGSLPVILTMRFAAEHPVRQDLLLKDLEESLPFRSGRASVVTTGVHRSACDIGGKFFCK